MLIGYVRVSTADQNRDHQIDALLRAGVDRHIHVEKASGAKASRPKLTADQAALAQQLRSACCACTPTGCSSGPEAAAASQCSVPSKRRDCREIGASACPRGLTGPEPP
ncbi:recombinase family protein [Streptomyces sp. Tu 2975]|uniref:recombinase family protein n=1 Tax=Streptomyces sp. Tu 2975 TaxID=2676871 RepID=UPI00244CB6C6|nr:recombinase family protein [Streptomyces sp. Tu 2975]